jgi:hypothetical protein
MATRARAASEHRAPWQPAAGTAGRAARPRPAPRRSHPAPKRAEPRPTKGVSLERQAAAAQALAVALRELTGVPVDKPWQAVTMETTDPDNGHVYHVDVKLAPAFPPAGQALASNPGILHYLAAARHRRRTSRDDPARRHPLLLRWWPASASPPRTAGRLTAPARAALSQHAGLPDDLPDTGELDDLAIGVLQSARHVAHQDWAHLSAADWDRLRRVAREHGPVDLDEARRGLRRTIEQELEGDALDMVRRYHDGVMDVRDARRRLQEAMDADSAQLGYGAPLAPESPFYPLFHGMGVTDDHVEDPRYVQHAIREAREVGTSPLVRHLTQGAGFTSNHLLLVDDALREAAHAHLAPLVHDPELAFVVLPRHIDAVLGTLRQAVAPTAYQPVFDDSDDSDAPGSPSVLVDDDDATPPHGGGYQYDPVLLSDLEDDAALPPEDQHTLRDLAGLLSAVANTIDPAGDGAGTAGGHADNAGQTPDDAWALLERLAGSPRRARRLARMSDLDPNHAPRIVIAAGASLVRMGVLQQAADRAAVAPNADPPALEAVMQGLPSPFADTDLVRTMVAGALLALDRNLRLLGTRLVDLRPARAADADLAAAVRAVADLCPALAEPLGPGHDAPPAAAAAAAAAAAQPDRFTETMLRPLADLLVSLVPDRAATPDTPNTPRTAALLDVPAGLAGAAGSVAMLAACGYNTLTLASGLWHVGTEASIAHGDFVLSGAGAAAAWLGAGNAALGETMAGLSSLATAPGVGTVVSGAATVAALASLAGLAWKAPVALADDPVIGDVAGVVTNALLGQAIHRTIVVMRDTATSVVRGALTVANTVGPRLGFGLFQTVIPVAVQNLDLIPGMTAIVEDHRALEAEHNAIPRAVDHAHAAGAGAQAFRSAARKKWLLGLPAAPIIPGSGWAAGTAATYNMALHMMATDPAAEEARLMDEAHWHAQGPDRAAAQARHRYRDRLALNARVVGATASAMGRILSAASGMALACTAAAVVGGLAPTGVVGAYRQPEVQLLRRAAQRRGNVADFHHQAVLALASTLDIAEDAHTRGQATLPALCGAVAAMVAECHADTAFRTRRANLLVGCVPPNRDDDVLPIPFGAANVRRLPVYDSEHQRWLFAIQQTMTEATQPRVSAAAVPPLAEPHPARCFTGLADPDLDPDPRAYYLPPARVLNALIDRAQRLPTTINTTALAVASEVVAMTIAALPPRFPDLPLELVVQGDDEPPLLAAANAPDAWADAIAGRNGDTPAWVRERYFAQARAVAMDVRATFRALAARAFAPGEGDAGAPDANAFTHMMHGNLKLVKTGQDWMTGGLFAVLGHYLNPVTNHDNAPRLPVPCEPIVELAARHAMAATQRELDAVRAAARRQQQQQPQGNAQAGVDLYTEMGWATALHDLSVTAHRLLTVMPLLQAHANMYVMPPTQAYPWHDTPAGRAAEARDRWTAALNIRPTVQAVAQGRPLEQFTDLFSQAVASNTLGVGLLALLAHVNFVQLPAGEGTTLMQYGVDPGPPPKFRRALTRTDPRHRPQLGDNAYTRFPRTAPAPLRYTNQVYRNTRAPVV